TVEQLTSNGENHNFYFIYSQTCYGSSFDDRYPNGSYASNDCMTEKFTTYEDGVLGVAGNSRYGLTGAGQRFDRYFFDAMCKSTDPQYIVSYMQEWSKFYAGYDTYGKRWTYYELNLFADPTLEFWKYSSLSSVLSVSVLTTPTIGMDQMTVQVGPAVLGMKVSICTENGIFGTGYTNASGNATINFNQPLNSEEIIYGMVTHESYLPYEFQTGWLPGIWTGEYSTSWHYFGNWEYEFVPASGDDVQIPSGTPNDPQIASSNAICRNLTIDSGASLTITGRTLDVEEDVTISGELVMDHNLSKLEVLENLIWSSGSTANITNPFIEIIVSGYFSFNSGADVQLENGDVRLSGGSNSALTSYDENCYMNNLRILKSGAQVNISGEFAETLNIHGDLFINSTSTLINFYPNNDILLKGDLNSQGNCMLQYGNLTFDGTIQSITTNSGDYFNDITFNSSSYAQLQSDVWIKGDVEFDMGSLDANGYDISIEGDWLTNLYYPSAFDAGTGTVTFNGTDDQICNGSSFNILKLYKPSGELIIQNVGRSMVQCNSYDWTQGILTIDGGMMTMSDLVNNGFYGTTQVISGTLNIFQDVNQYVDLNGSLIIYDGAVNVNGGDDTSYWPYSEDAYLYMEGGTLDFKDHSININTSYAFSHVISGGTIRATGDFTIERHDFHPTGGRVELYGSEGANIDLGSWGNYLHILEIDKETSRSNNDAKIISNSRNFDDSVSKKNTSRRPETLVYETSRTNSITVQSDLEIHDNLYIDNGTYILNGNTVEVLGDAWISGTLEMTNSLDHLDVTGDVDWQSGSSDNITAGEISLEGDWEFSGGTTASLGIGNTVRIDGTGTSQITIAEFDNASFGTVILDKTSYRNDEEKRNNIQTR
ncbi:MAG: hypothetical protein H8E57_00310, partial [Candidatus Cloacimonetes bacterium]|nr:hypothetical protein [Candidatus Cloacimonadota bacterium]